MNHLQQLEHVLILGLGYRLLSAISILSDRSAGTQPLVEIGGEILPVCDQQALSRAVLRCDEDSIHEYKGIRSNYAQGDEH